MFTAETFRHRVFPVQRCITDCFFEQTRLPLETYREDAFLYREIFVSLHIAGVLLAINNKICPYPKNPQELLSRNHSVTGGTEV
jgi:hypothetical protein